MKTNAHILSSWRRLKKLNFPVYQSEKREAFDLLKNIQLWLDEFYCKKTEDFDYSSYPLSHRQKRHHVEGIEECVQIFSEKYGAKYKDIIRREASEHIKADMHLIPQKQDYSKKDFWENWSLRYEWFFNE